MGRTNSVPFNLLQDAVLTFDGLYRSFIFFNLIIWDYYATNAHNFRAIILQMTALVAIEIKQMLLIHEAKLKIILEKLRSFQKIFVSLLSPHPKIKKQPSVFYFRTKNHKFCPQILDRYRYFCPKIGDRETSSKKGRIMWLLR